jgi:pimeloyl-ACP methyl ester carboxylesterase
LACLTRWGIDKAHVVGASMGGMIVQHMAASHPQKVASLTSIMSTSGKRGLPGPRTDIRKAMMRPRPANPTREEAVTAGATVVKAFSYPDPARADGAIEELVGRAFDRGYYPVGTVRQLLAIVADGSRVDMLKTIKAPSLVIHGGADPLVPKEGGIDTAKHIAGARLEIIDEMAHDLPPSQLATLVQLIADHAASAS